MSSPLTFCISTYNNLNYLKLAVASVRKNSYFKNSRFIIHAENCTDGTNEWLQNNDYNIEYYIENNKTPLGIGGGMNFCADKVNTEYIMFLHSDFYVAKDWDVACWEEAGKHKEPTWVFSHRVEPDIFGHGQSRPGTVVIPKDSMGSYYHDFDIDFFEQWSDEFVKLNSFTYPKAEGVSGLISKKNWDLIGGNDPIFAPTSWEDIDLFLRMKKANYKFVLTSKSVVWHFGARGSHRLEANNGITSDRQLNAEVVNAKKFYDKWNGMPMFDEYGMVCGIK